MLKGERAGGEKPRRREFHAARCVPDRRVVAASEGSAKCRKRAADHAIRPIVAGNLLLQLDGVSCGSIRSFTGGAATADVIEELGPGVLLQETSRARQV